MVAGAMATRHRGSAPFGLGLTGQDGDASAVADAERGSNLLGEDKLDALLLYKRHETVAVLSDLAAHLPHRGKLRALGLQDIEDVGVAEANQDAGVLPGDVLLGLCARLALDADDGSNDVDAVIGTPG
jgi:hypothetical protein